MIQSSKETFIMVARALFATKGFANTSMNDIANASNKGRRTLYTYFRSKEEIFYAVIQLETMTIRDHLKQVVIENKPPLERLFDYLFSHLKEVKDVVVRNGGLEAEFFQNQNLVERVRHRLDFHERKFLEQILEDGVSDGSMNVPDIPFTALIMQSALKGMELPFIRGELAAMMQENRKNIFQFITDGFCNSRLE